MVKLLFLFWSLRFCYSTSESEVKQKGKRFFYYLNIVNAKKKKIEDRVEKKNIKVLFFGLPMRNRSDFIFVSLLSLNVYCGVFYSIVNAKNSKRNEIHGQVFFFFVLLSSSFFTQLVYR